jgi:predicted phosphodiesterase
MILFAGDPHGRFKPIIDAVRLLRPAGIVLLGDHDLDMPLEQALDDVPELTQVWWIPGNHDGDRDEWYDYLFGSALADRNLNGRVCEIGDLRVAGLGGVFRGKVWHPGEDKPRFDSRDAFVHRMGRGNRWRGGLPRQHHVSIWWEDYERLAGQRADVLVCHEAPGSHRFGFGVLDELARQMGARMIVHGHHHTDYRETLPDGIQVIGVGLAGVTTDEGVIVSPGLTGAQARRIESL